VGRSRSRSRLELEAKRLGLVSVSDLNVSFTSLNVGRWLVLACTSDIVRPIAPYKW